MDLGATIATWPLDARRELLPHRRSGFTAQGELVLGRLSVAGHQTLHAPALLRRLLLLLPVLVLVLDCPERENFGRMGGRQQQQHGRRWGWNLPPGWAKGGRKGLSHRATLQKSCQQGGLLHEAYHFRARRYSAMLCRLGNGGRTNLREAGEKGALVGAAREGAREALRGLRPPSASHSCGSLPRRHWEPRATYMEEEDR
mmetsp:Transcript_31359/g.66600  ORF Transcript_31359/g.66600 Transcript_31359/m.66600 type:complete len:200 (+) Transcript_31359:558-1157(+)